MPVPDRWGAVDWSQPVRHIAAQLQVSRQRVYQVMTERGVPRQPWGQIRDRLAALDTTSLTAAEAAAQVGCSVNYLRTLLRQAGRRCRRPRPAGNPRFAAFAAYLREHRAYAAGTIHGVCTRCGRVERSYGLQLDRVLAPPEGLARLYRRIDADPSLGVLRLNFRFAVRRYAEFLQAHRSQEAAR
jgi:hypothetical protein